MAKMNILFLTISRINDINKRGIYTDLIKALLSDNHSVYVASPTERRNKEKTHLIESDNVKILKVRTLNIQKTNVVEKGIGTILLENQFNSAIDKYWGDVKFDIIIYSTPPITFNKVIEKLKEKFNAKTYLLLKDIFPQNAVDLGMLKPKGLLYKFFRKKEKKLYQISDHIGCMSPANREYVISRNPDCSPSKVEIFPNSLIPLPLIRLSEEDRKEILSKLAMDSKKVISVYGGNLGKPQGIDFLIKVLQENEKRSNHHILIVGDGTEFSKLKQWFDNNKPINATLLSRLPKESYDKLIKIADIGLIFLDHRFTIPNYPSRLLSYLENGIPVMVASDPNTDIGKITEENGFGYWCESDSVKTFFNKMDYMIANSALRKRLGENGRKYFETNYDVSKYINLILS